MYNNYRWSIRYWFQLFKQDPLKYILPVASVIWSVYCIYRLTYARTVIEAVKYGVFSILNAIARGK